MGGKPVGENDGGATDAEQAVGDEHGALVAKVPVLGDVFCADDQGSAARVDLRIRAAEYHGPHDPFCRL